jgi:hypothetical protein
MQGESLNNTPFRTYTLHPSYSQLCELWARRGINMDMMDKLFAVLARKNIDITTAIPMLIGELSERVERDGQ